MSKVSVFAKFSCQEGKGEEMDGALRAVVAASESVDGVESYSYHRAEDGTYWFFALMSSMEAAQRHGDNEAMQAAMPALMGLMAGPPDMAMTTPVAGSPLPRPVPGPRSGTGGRGPDGGVPMIIAKESSYLEPLCPHCGTTFSEIHGRILSARGSSGFSFGFGKRYVYACPSCRKVLGVSHRKGFWAG